MAKQNKLQEFHSKHPILFHLCLILCVTMVLLICCHVAMNIFTGHGKYKYVPAVEGMSLDEAASALQAEGLHWEVVDSIYSESVAPGAVVDQNPKAGSQVKVKRTIYLMVCPSSPRTITLPNVKDVSVRQGRSMLEALGFKNVQIVTVPSPYEGLILNVEAAGRPVEPGTLLTPTTLITLTVGSGSNYIFNDSLTDDEEFVEVNPDLM